jgi:8-oxo-dGTP pyrophosphatase MutT (NUDIX family)
VWSREEDGVRERVRAAVTAHSPREIPLGDQRESAVMLLLHERDGVEHLLFQVRSATMVMHTGQIGFPGGARSRGDTTLLDTALREVEEEIGVPRDHIEVFGRIDDGYTNSSHYRIRPYVGAVQPGPREFAIDAGEVYELLEIPLEWLLSPDARGWMAVQDEQRIEPAPAFIYGEHAIYGATWRILNQFVTLIAGGRSA